MCRIADFCNLVGVCDSLKFRGWWFAAEFFRSTRGGVVTQDDAPGRDSKKRKIKNKEILR